MCDCIDLPNAITMHVTTYRDVIRDALTVYKYDIQPHAHFSAFYITHNYDNNHTLTLCLIARIPAQYSCNYLPPTPVLHLDVHSSLDIFAGARYR